MSVEEKLKGWTGPASATEAEKQARTERMIKAAIDSHDGLADANLSVFSKGSYPNNTNVRADSDVDVAVQCHNVFFWEEEAEGAAPQITPYNGSWTADRLRADVEDALREGFGSEVDTSGSTAIRIRSSTARIDADVIPCFDYRYFFREGGQRDGIRIFKKAGAWVNNFPSQHLEQGRAKNRRTGGRYKQAVRIAKRLENLMVADGDHREVPSFLIESLLYNCPDAQFNRPSWTDTTKALLFMIWDHTQGDVDPPVETERWLEANAAKYLFGSHQKWSRRDAREFSYAAWNYLGYG